MGLGLCSQGWGPHLQLVSGKTHTLMGCVRFYEKRLYHCWLALRAEGWSMTVSADGPQGSGGVRAQLCLTLCDPMDCSPSSSSVHGVFQARILEWVAISYSRGSSPPRDWNCISCIGWQILCHWEACLPSASCSSLPPWVCVGVCAYVQLSTCVCVGHACLYKANLLTTQSLCPCVPLVCNTDLCPPSPKSQVSNISWLYPNDPFPHLIACSFHLCISQDGLYDAVIQVTPKSQWFKTIKVWGFPGGPVGKTLFFHFKGHRFPPCQGTKIPHATQHG